MLLSCVRGNRLGAATALRELWVQNNRIRDLTAAANALKGLPQLQKVVFKPNPCCAEEEDEKLCRMYLLSQLRSLRPKREEYRKGKYFQELAALWPVDP